MCCIQLSQILGHSDQLYTRLPRGLRVWQYTNAVTVTGLAAAVSKTYLLTYTNSRDRSSQQLESAAQGWIAQPAAGGGMGRRRGGTKNLGQTPGPGRPNGQTDMPEWVQLPR